MSPEVGEEEIHKRIKHLWSLATKSSFFTWLKVHAWDIMNPV